MSEELDDAIALRDCPVHGLIQAPDREGDPLRGLCPVSIREYEACGLELAAPRYYVRAGDVADLIEAADRVCSEAEAHDEQWRAFDYELYEPLRVALDRLTR